MEIYIATTPWNVEMKNLVSQKFFIKEEQKEKQTHVFYALLVLGILATVKI